MSKNLNIFNSIKLSAPKSSVFDLTHDVKLSLDMGQLVPTCIVEALPGDKFNISSESLLRFAPLISPVMHRMDVSMHYFFVPNRISWPNWEKWITGDIANAVHPYISYDQAMWDEHRLFDYLGLPRPASDQTQVLQCNALPFAAYQRVYNDFYRDQNLITESTTELVEGDNFDTAFLTLRRRAWEHDYFTSALPFAQKGDAVDIPLGNVELNPEYFDPTANAEMSPSFFGKNNQKFVGELGQEDGIVPGGFAKKIYVGGDPSSANPTLDGNAYDPDGTLIVEPTSVNDLRRAFKLQEWLEKNARAGTRYVENILAHFGVKSSDARMQRPEYITGTKSPVVISEVLANNDNGTLPQGNMAGHGISVSNGGGNSYRCEEHGFIIGIMSVMPKTAYQQGLPKHFIKNDRFDYYWPSFANIGEQEIQNREIYVDHPQPLGTFGYVPRYSEYKYQQNRVAGDFRDTLNFWHYGRIFASAPNLNQAFIECNPDKRIFAVIDPNENSLYCHVLNKITAVRKMPKFGTPML